MTSSPLLRLYTPDDASAVAEIIDHYAVNGFVSYNSKPYGSEVVARISALANDYPCYVVEVDGKVVGSGGLMPLHPGDCVLHAAEIGYSFLPEYCGRGLGTLLLDRLESAAREKGVTTLLASISSRNELSLEFHRKHGFVECGRFNRVGRKFDQEFDIVWMQKFL